MVRILTTLLVLTLLGSSMAFAGVMGLYAYYARDLPDPGQLAQRQLFQTARLFDRNGVLLEELVDPTGGRRTSVPLAQVPQVLRDATIAAEDASFYSNPGFDVRAIARATYQWVRYGEPQSGASTITQQLVKNTLLSPEQTPERKVKEAFLAMEVARRYSKDQILEMYLNEIYYGNRAYGAEAASETYFGKGARELTLTEASLLAGLPQAPAYYDPYTNLTAARERQQYVLGQMVRTGTITQQAADAALRAPVNLKARAGGSTAQAPHFTAYVRQLLEDQFGSDALFRNGLQVTTTLDVGWLRTAERIAREKISEVRQRDVNNAALVTIKPESGEILAMLGSLDFSDTFIDGQVNVALAERQPGSALKPFTYLTAFNKGWNPATLLMDIPTDFGAYRPNNFDNRFRGPINARQALGQSLNIPAVLTLEFATIPETLNTLHRMGVNSLRDPQRYGLSVTLGGGEVRLLDLTYAYAVLANGGKQAGTAVPAERRQPGYRQLDPVAILKVTDSTGKTLYQYQAPQTLEVADARVVHQVTSILMDDDARVPTFGRGSTLVLKGRPAAVKTGTTDKYVDSWIVGYTPDVVTGVWVGNTDSSPMKDVGGSLGAGAIWNAYMEEIVKGTPPREFRRPEGVVEAEVCALSALLPTPECRESQLPIHGTVRDLFVPGVNLPTKPDDMHQRVEVCIVSGKRAVPLTPLNGRELRVFTVWPERYRGWAEQNGFPPPPKEDCGDVYRGERKAEIAGPRPSDRLQAGQQVQVVGSAFIDDFAAYTLDVGSGANPSEWRPITQRRPQGVDNGLLGVWDTANQPAGQYTLRVTAFDSLENAVEGRTTVNLSAAPTPTAVAQPTPTPGVQPTPTRQPVGNPRPTSTPVPAAPKPTVRPGG